MGKLAILAAAAVLFGAASAKADQAITFPQLGGGLTVGNSFQLGQGSLTHFGNTASSGVGVDGPFVSVSGSNIVNGSEVLTANATINWDFEVLAPADTLVGTQVNLTITGTYDASVTSAAGGGVGNIFVGPNFAELTSAFHQECDGGDKGQCGHDPFEVQALVTVNEVEEIELQVNGVGGDNLNLGHGFSFSIDPMLSLSPDLIDQGFSLQVEPDALPPPITGGVPEPAAWTLMILGFGMAGASLRRRRALAG